MFKSYKNKKVLVTGHTGFKGSWLTIWLLQLGAKVVGYALDPASEKGNFVKSGLADRLTDYRHDIRDFNKLHEIVEKEKPDIIHLHTTGSMGYIGTICSKLFKIPCVGTYHTLISEQLMYVSLKKLLKIEKGVDKILGSKIMNVMKKSINIKKSNNKHKVKKKDRIKNLNNLFPGGIS